MSLIVIGFNLKKYLAILIPESLIKTRNMRSVKTTMYNVLSEITLMKNRSSIDISTTGEKIKA